MEREWEAEGLSTEDRLARIREIAEREAREAEDDSPPEPKPEAPGENVATAAADWPICPVCAGIGHVPPELRPAHDKDTCPACAGMGLVATGSLVSDYAMMQCARCMGNGYVDIPQTNDNRTVDAPEYARRW